MSWVDFTANYVGRRSKLTNRLGILPIQNTRLLIATNAPVTYKNAATHKLPHALTVISSSAM